MKTSSKGTFRPDIEGYVSEGAPLVSMNGTIYHYLTETDSFSDLHGAALQRWVANVLRLDGRKAVVVTPRADESWGLKNVEAYKLLGLRLYSNIKGRYRFPVALRLALLRQSLLPAVKKLKAGDVVWIHNRPDYASAIGPLVRKAGARLILHLHNSLLITFPEKIVQSLSADRLVFCSHFLEKEAKEKFPKLTGTEVIHNGADGSRFFPATDSDKAVADRRKLVALFAGRLVPEKGAHVFLDAMRILYDRGVPLEGKVVGATGFGSNNPSTPYLEKLRQTAPPNVELCGYRPGSALGDELRRSDIFCCPSTWDEPFGLVNVEAMATGVPTVATHAGGIPEIFSQGGGILTPRGSAPDLAEALQKIATDPDLRSRLATEALDSFQRNFTWRAVHKRYDEVLSSL